MEKARFKNELHEKLHTHFKLSSDKNECNRKLKLAHSCMLDKSAMVENINISK